MDVMKTNQLIQVSPSMMCADLCNLERDLRRLESIGVDLLHFDLMDAHFVPNMPIGLFFLEQLRAKTNLPYDVHLMVEDNDFFVQKVVEIGVQQIAIHAESATHLDRTLSLIQKSGARAGVALNPSTSLAAIEYVLDRIDFLMIMSVNPGFAGQKMVPSALKKIAACRQFLEQRGIDIPIEVDGNVSFSNIPDMVAVGADILVAGTSSIFSNSGNYSENMARIKEAIHQGLEQRKNNQS